MTMAHSSKKLNPIDLSSRGGDHILNGQIIVKNRILDEMTQISATLYVREYCWVCEALQLSTSESIVPQFLYSRRCGGHSVTKEFMTI